MNVNEENNASERNQHIDPDTLQKTLTPLIEAIVAAQINERLLKPPSVGETSRSQEEAAISASMDLDPKSPEERPAIQNQQPDVEEENDELLRTNQDPQIKGAPYETEKNKFSCVYHAEDPRTELAPKKSNLPSKHQEPSLSEVIMDEIESEENEQLSLQKIDETITETEERELNGATEKVSNAAPFFVIDVAQTEHAYCKNRKTLETAIQQVEAKTNEIEKTLKTNAVYMNTPKKPIFSSYKLQNPVCFLYDLKKYLNRLSKEQQTVDTIVDCLVEPALTWAIKNKHRWSNKHDFKKDFLAQWWGPKAQNSVRKLIFRGINPSPIRKTGMAAYFIRLVTHTKYLTNKIPKDELITEIMYHFPKSVQIAWHGSQKRTVIKAVDFLRKMDDLGLGTPEGTANIDKKCQYVLGDDD